MAVKFRAIRWAREVPTLLHRGRVDRLGHHLLLIMATYASNDGSGVYAAPATLAKEAHASESDVRNALARLEHAGLIGPDHGPNGIPGWALNLNLVFEADPVAEDRATRRREADRERQRRRRERIRGSGHAQVDRDVTRESAVTDEGVTQESGVSHAGVNRDRGDVTHKSGVSHASKTVTTAGQTPHNSIGTPYIRTPEELQSDPAGSESASVVPFPTPQPATRGGYTEAFEAAWDAYGRRGAKKAAFREWQKAIKRASPDEIAAAIPTYVEATPELRFRKHMERWLRDDGWESAVVPARQAAGGWQPYRNPNTDDYDEPFI